MSGGNSQDGFNKDRAELFEALGHPTRIKILQVLSESPLGFSDLKKEASIESNGLFSFHLGKLDGLVKSTSEGNYTLSDEGKEALRMMAAKESVKNEAKVKNPITSLHIIAFILLIALVLTAIVSFNNYQQLSSAFNNLNESFNNLNRSFNDLNQRYYLLVELISSQSASATNQSIGLNLKMTMNVTSVYAGQGISITLSETNSLAKFNNITASDSWAYSGFPAQTCIPGPGNSNMPYALAIVQGNYSVSDLNGRASQPIYYLGTAYTGGIPSEYDFYPSSNFAIVLNGTYNPDVNESITNATSYSSFYIPDMYYMYPGVYTIIGGDEWGQLVVLHLEIMATPDMY